MNPVRSGLRKSSYYSGFSSIGVDGTGNMHVAWDDYKNCSISRTDWDIFTCDGMPLAVNWSRSRWSPMKFDFVMSSRSTALPYSIFAYIGRELHLNAFDHLRSFQYWVRFDLFFLDRSIAQKWKGHDCNG